MLLRISISFLLISGFISQTLSQDSSKNLSDTIIRKNIAIIKYKPNINPYQDPNEKYLEWTPNDSDLLIIDSLFNNCLDNYNASQTKAYYNFKNKHPKTILTLDHFRINNYMYYKRQYIPFLNENGEKLVWINCFCAKDEFPNDWKNELIIVFDGGNCYFHLTINLTQKKTYLFVNSDG